MALLSVEDIRVEFGGIVALADLSFTIDAGQICALIGPNGAGKTTLFNCVSRLYHPTSGTIRFDGQDLLRMPAHRIARVGIARTFQNLALFPALSVLDNVLIGGYTHGRVNARRAEAHSILQRLSLDDLAARPAVGLPYGTLKRVEIARALAARPKLLLLDEPTAGMNTSETREMTDFIRKLRAELGLTVLLIEHDMRVVMGISDRVTVLDHGEVIAKGSPDEVRRDEEVLRAYLGRNTQAAHAGEVEAGAHVA